MMHTDSSNDRNYFLELMGIDAWQLRAQSQEVSCVTFALQALEQQQIVGVLKLEPIVENENETLQLLDAMLAAIKLKRSDAVCENQSLEIIMGESLAKKILNSSESLDEMRTKNIYEINNIKTLVTYHPKDLLQNPQHKKKAWEDLKKIRDC